MATMWSGKNGGLHTRQMLFDLSRLTLFDELSGSSPMIALNGLLESCVEEEPERAGRFFHQMTAALHETPSRRLTGGLLQDWILYYVLEVENLFSKCAAAQKWDMVLYEALKVDLGILAGLFQVSDEDIKDTISLLTKVRKQEGPLSGVVWNGDKVASVNPHRKLVSDIQPNLNLTWWSKWTYELEPVDEADRDTLRTMAAMFCREKEWSTLADELWQFHGICGCGDFVRYRFFSFEGNLHPVVAPSGLDLSDLYGFESHKQMLIKNMLQFVNSQPHQHVLVFGKDGIGKTTLSMALMGGAISTLRVVLMSGGMDTRQYLDLLQTLAQQPLKFILFFDDYEFSPSDYSALRRALGVVGCPNIMLYATARQAPFASLFTLNVELEPLAKDQFVEMVSFILNKKGISMRRDRIARNYCADIPEKSTSRMAEAVAATIVLENT
ncbi:MAG: DUF815 domain-containing protein [Christensenellales bacterium]|jgi:hypothetical protein